MQETVNNILEPINGRKPDGTFAPGNQAAVGHRPYQRYADRARYLQEQFTAEEILALANDETALSKRAAIDTIVIRRIARAMKRIEPETCADVERAAEAHLDRVEGKPKGDEERPIIQNNINVFDAIPLKEVARRLGFLLLEAQRE